MSLAELEKSLKLCRNLIGVQKWFHDSKKEKDRITDLPAILPEHEKSKEKTVDYEQKETGYIGPF